MMEQARLSDSEPGDAVVRKRRGSRAEDARRFRGDGRLNRQDFGVSWNSTLDRGGVVVGDDIDITIDAEAILEKPAI